MILVVGGLGAGKRKFIREELGYAPEQLSSVPEEGTPVLWGLEALDPLPPLEDLLGRSEEKAPVEEEFSDPMLVFCNLPHEKLDHLLTAMGRAGLPRIALKAMLTPTNRTWTSQQLWTELRREHEAMQAQRQQKK